MRGGKGRREQGHRTLKLHPGWLEILSSLRNKKGKMKKGNRVKETYGI